MPRTRCMAPWVLALAGLAAATQVAGCGAALTGAIAGLASKKDGGSNPPLAPAVNLPPGVTSGAATGDTDDGSVTIELVLQDPEADPVALELRYSTDPNQSSTETFTGVATGVLTAAAGGAAVTDLGRVPTSAAGTTYRFEWNTALDLGATLNAGVRVQVLVGGRALFTTNLFEVDNTGAPLVAAVELPALPAGATVFADRQSAAGAIPLRVTLIDADSQAVDVEVLFSTGGGAFSSTNVAAGSFVDAAGQRRAGKLDTSPSGVTYTFEWASALNGIGSQGSVGLRFTATDTKTGAPRDSAAFAVNNAAFSVLLDTPGGTPADEVELDYLLLDDAGGQLDVTVEYSTSAGASGSFLPCSAAAEKRHDGTSGLAASPAPGTSHRFVWNAFRDLSPQGVRSAAAVVLRITPRRASTGVAGQAATTSAFPVDQRLIATVWNEGDALAEAPGTTLQLSPTAGVACDAGQVLFTLDRVGLVARYERSTGLVRLLAGGGDRTGEGIPADEALLESAGGLALDGGGNAYFVDTRREGRAAALLRVDAASKLLTQLVEVTFGATGSTLRGPALASDRVVFGAPNAPSDSLLSVGFGGGAATALNHPGAVAVVSTAVPLFVETLDIAIGPGANPPIYAAVGGSGVWSTADGAASPVVWTRRSEELAVACLAADFGNARVFAGVRGGGIRKSSDGGTTWVARGPATATVLDIAIDPATPSVVYAGTAGAGVLKSSDAGETWAATGLGAGTVSALEVEVGAVYAGLAPGGVWRSTDGGATWTAVTSGLSDPNVSCLAFESATTGYAGTAAGGVFKTSDSGATWTPMNNGLQSTDVLALAAPGGGTVLAGTAARGSFLSTDGGASWSSFSFSNDLRVAAVAASGAGVWAGTRRSGAGGELLFRHVAAWTRQTGAVFGNSARVVGLGLAPGPLADTFLVSEPAAHHVLAFNIGRQDRTIAGQVVPPGAVRRVAGTGSGTPEADPVLPGPALARALRSPTGVASEAGTGAILVAETGGNRVWRVDAAGGASVVAGRLKPGFSGDGGPATAALLGGPLGITADPAGGAGAFVFADYGNGRIRAVSAGGTITTLVGSFPDVRDGGAATTAILDDPAGVALGPGGELLIADREHDRLRRVTTAEVIGTVAGNGASGVSGDGQPALTAAVGDPIGALLDASGRIYVSQRTGVVRRIEATGVISTVVGTGTPGNGAAGDPEGGSRGQTALGGAAGWLGGLALAGDILLVADPGNDKVWAVNFGTAAAVVAGVTVGADECRRVAGDPQGVNPTAALAQALDEPVAVAWDAGTGDFFLAERGGHRILRVTAAGGVSVVAGTGVAGISGTAGAAEDAATNPLRAPGALVRDPFDPLLIFTDDGNQRVRMVHLGAVGNVTRFDRTVAPGEMITVAGRDDGASGFAGDGGLARDALLALAVLDGSDVDDDSALGGALAVDAARALLLADVENDRVRKVLDDGRVLTVAGGGRLDGDGGAASEADLTAPLAATRTAAGDLLVFDAGRVRQLRAVDTVVSSLLGNGASGPPVASAGLAQVNLRFNEGLEGGEQDATTGLIQGLGGGVTTSTRVRDTGYDFGPDGLDVQPGTLVRKLDAGGRTLALALVVGVDAVDPSVLHITTIAPATFQDGDSYALTPPAGPRGLAARTWSGASLLAVADTLNHAVLLANLGGATLSLAGGASLPPGQVVLIGGGTDGAGGFADGDIATSRYRFPQGVTILPNGLVGVADTGNHCIRIVNPWASGSAFAGTPIAAGQVSTRASIVSAVARAVCPQQLTCDSLGNLLWTEQGDASDTPGANPRPAVRMLAHVSGSYYGAAVTQGQTQLVLLNLPEFSGGPRLWEPRGLGLDAAGDLYVVDHGRHAVLLLERATGFLTRVAGAVDSGTGEPLDGFSGDGGIASQAELSRPWGLAVGGDAFWVIDSGNQRIRRARRFP